VNPPPQPVAVPTPAERRLRRSALVLAALSAVFAVSFLALSRAVVGGRTANLDRQVLLAMREADDPSDPIGPRWFEEACRDMTALGGGTVLAILCALVIAFFWLAGMRRAAVYVAIAVVGAALLSAGLKRAFERPRPDLVPHGQHVYTSSWLVASRFVPRRRLKALLLVAAALVTAAVGASGVYLGVHWPSDVLAGWAVGAAWALLCWCAAAWLQDYGVLEQDIYHPEDGVT
jgi:undecaprenyl-diphosphatase